MPGSRSVHYDGLALLTSLCALGLQRIRSPNGWVIGRLLIAAA